MSTPSPTAQTNSSEWDPDWEDPLEKDRLVTEVLNMQANLRALISRVESAKQEHQSLAAENQILQKYINNSLTSTAVFGATGGALGGVAGTGQGIGVGGGMVAGGFVTRKEGGK